MSFLKQIMYLEKELKAAINAAKKASKVILDYYHHGFRVETKADDSPVTSADKASDKLIREMLSKEFKDYAFLTEESYSKNDLDRFNHDYVWIVDPLDGTKDFVCHDDSFTINIALSYKHEAVLGVVLIPVRNEIYFATKGSGAFVERNGEIKKIHVSEKTSDLICFTSAFHFTDEEKAMIKKHEDKIKHVKKQGSSVKACLIAEGKGEISYRLNDGTKEWDTAAFQIIVEEAGGFVLKPNGERIRYNREDVYNRDGYVIMNKKENFLL